MPDPVTGVLAAGSIGSAAIGANASNNAARAARRSSRDANALQERIYEEGTERMQPFVEGGLGGYKALLYEAGLGEMPEGYGGYQMSPMAQMALETGRGTIEGGAAGAGNLYSGNTLKTLEDYRSRVVGADQDRYMGRLMNIAGMGQSAAAGQGAAGANFAGNVGQNMMGSAAMQGRAYMSGAEAIQGGITDLAGIYGYSQNPMSAYGKSSMKGPK